MRTASGLDLWRLLRPANATVSAAAAYVGAILAGGAWAPGGAAVAAMVASFAFAAAGNVRNDLADVEVDRLAHPGRPLARGAVAPAQARALIVGLYLLALAAGVLVSWWGFLLVVAAMPVMEGYDRWWKARGLAGNLAIALLTAAPFVLGALAAGGADAAVLAVAALAALATAGREVLKDVEDAEADAPYRRTLPHRIGSRRATLVAGAFLVAAVALSPVPWMLETVLGEWYLPAVGAADLCFLGAAALGPRRPDRAQRLAKLGMVVALVALVVGRAQVGLA